MPGYYESYLGGMEKLAPQMLQQRRLEQAMQQQEKMNEYREGMLSARLLQSQKEQWGEPKEVTGPDGTPILIQHNRTTGEVRDVNTGKTIGANAAGGQVQPKSMLNAPQAKLHLDDLSANVDLLTKEADSIKNNKALWRTTGLVGSLPDVPGSEAADLRAQLESLKTKTGFGALQSMRNASKTGGALGQVSDREEAMLQRAIASLDTSQSPAALRKSLDIVMDQAKGAKERMRRAYVATYGQVPTPSRVLQPQAAPKGRFLGYE